MKLEEFISKDALKEKIARDGKVVIRPSSINQFMSCPAQWFRASVLQDYQKPSAAAAVGTSLHKGVEVGYREKINTGEVPPVSLMTDAAVSEFHDLVKSDENLEFKEGESFSGFEQDLVKGVKDYHATIMPVIDPVGVEVRYTLPMDGLETIESVSGTIDIDLPNSLADIKMMGKNKPVTNYVAQQSCYAILKETNDKPCSDTAFIHKVIRGKNVEITPLPLKKEWARTWVNMMITTLETFADTGNPMLFRGSSPQSNFLCNEKWCGFWDQCPFVKHLK